MRRIKPCSGGASSARNRHCSSERRGNNAFNGPVAQWIRHRPTEPGIAGSSPAGVISQAWQTSVSRKPTPNVVRNQPGIRQVPQPPTPRTAEDSAPQKLAKPKVQMCARQRLTNAGRTSGLKAFNVRAPCRPNLSPNQTLRKQPCTCVQRHVCWKHDVVS